MRVKRKIPSRKLRQELKELDETNGYKQTAERVFRLHASHGILDDLRLPEETDMNARENLLHCMLLDDVAVRKGRTTVSNAKRIMERFVEKESDYHELIDGLDFDKSKKRDLRQSISNMVRGVKRALPKMTSDGRRGYDVDPQTIFLLKQIHEIELKKILGERRHIVFMGGYDFAMRNHRIRRRNALGE